MPSLRDLIDGKAPYAVGGLHSCTPAVAADSEVEADGNEDAVEDETAAATKKKKVKARMAEDYGAHMGMNGID